MVLKSNEGAHISNVKSRLSYGERNAFALVLFMYSQLKENADLIILDDPISSFDKNKKYGQIVTFQAPKLFKESVDNAVKLYSAGSTEKALVAEWEEIEPAFRKALAALKVSAETPEKVTPMSIKEKKVFVKMFQTFDHLFAQLKSFT